MIDSSKAFRSKLSTFLTAVSTVVDLTWDARYGMTSFSQIIIAKDKSLLKEEMEPVRRSMRELSACFTAFRDSLHFQKHAFYFEAVKHCHDILAVCLRSRMLEALSCINYAERQTATFLQETRSQKAFRKPRTHLNYLFDDFIPNLEIAMNDVIIELRSFREKCG